MVQKRFERATEIVVAKVKEDKNILAAILFGSLSYDTVWEKSDIDLMLITTEIKASGVKEGCFRAFALHEEGVNIHATVQPRSGFRKMIEGSLQGSFIQSSFAKSKLLFTRDETIRELYEKAHELGERDRKEQLFLAGANLLPSLCKAEKFCKIKKDPLYGFLWITYTYDGLARIEACLHREIATREVIQQALLLNPDFFEVIYTELIQGKKTLKRVGAALDLIDSYLEEKIPLLFQPVLDYLASAASPRSATEIQHWFEGHMNVQGGVTACEWLADKEVITKVSSPVRLTPRSLVEFEELAFYYTKD